MRLRGEDGKFTRTTKVITTVCAVVGTLVTVATGVIKFSDVNTWDNEFAAANEKTLEMIQRLEDQMLERRCEYIISELNRLRAKERSGLELTEYDTFWQDQLKHKKDRICN